MKNALLTITENRQLTKDVYKMVLAGDTTECTHPGQFVNLKLAGFYLRRPISVCDCEQNSLTLLYKTVGHGTEAMSKMLPGDVIDTLTGLGNGFDTTKSGENPILLGGGIGLPPMYGLAKRLVAEGKSVTVIAGFNTATEVFYEEEIKALGAKTIVTTADGSYGMKGFVTDALRTVADYSFSYCCGPEPMLRAVYATAKTSGQYSFEERMGCGFGACMGCSCKTKYGNKRICKDGPVLEKEEIIW